MRKSHPADFEGKVSDIVDEIDAVISADNSVSHDAMRWCPQEDFEEPDLPTLLTRQAVEGFSSRRNDIHLMLAERDEALWCLDLSRIQPRWTEWETSRDLRFLPTVFHGNNFVLIAGVVT